MKPIIVYIKLSSFQNSCFHLPTDDSNELLIYYNNELQLFVSVIVYMCIFAHQQPLQWFFAKTLSWGFGTYTGLGTSVTSLKHVMKSTTKKKEGVINLLRVLT